MGVATKSKGSGEMSLDKTEGARVLNAAEVLCIQQGNATAEEVAVKCGLDAVLVAAELATLARRGVLAVRPGEIYSRNFMRQIRLAGQQHPTSLRRPCLAAMMGGH